MRSMVKAGFVAGLLALVPAVAQDPAKPETKGQDTRLVKAQVQADINATLQRLAKTLRANPNVAEVTEQLAEHPQVGLVHWDWYHFGERMTDKEIVSLEASSKELLDVMRAVRAMPDAGLDELMHEGMELNKAEAWMSECRGAYRNLIAQQHTVTIPVGLGLSVPSKRRIEEELKNPANLSVAFPQLVGMSDGTNRTMTLSPLGRVGPGYALAHHDNLRLVPSEDTALFRKAIDLQYTANEEEYQEHVLRRRNEHFVKITADNRRLLVHLLLGCGHDLHSAVLQNNVTNPRKVSLVVVTVKGLVEEKAEEKKRQQRK